MEKRHDSVMTAAAVKAMGGKVLMSVEEVAEMLSLGRTVVYRLIMGNDVRSVKIGRRRRIVVSSLDEDVARLAGHGNQ